MRAMLLSAMGCFSKRVFACVSVIPVLPPVPLPHHFISTLLLCLAGSAQYGREVVGAAPSLWQLHHCSLHCTHLSGFRGNGAPFISLLPTSRRHILYKAHRNNPINKHVSVHVGKEWASMSKCRIVC